MTLFEPRPRGDRRRGSRSLDDPFVRLRRDRTLRRLALVAIVACGIASAAAIGVTAIGWDRLAAMTQALPWSEPEPAPALVALADRAQLTDEGRALFYRTQPELTSFEAVQAACDRSGDGHVVGCYSGAGVSFGTAGRMYLYQPADERLTGDVVVTLAHELLHAVYAGMTEAEQGRINQLVAAEYPRVPADAPLHEQLEGSVAGYESNRGNELFAYLGTQFHPDGGLAPELEAVYARYFVDRRALVGIYDASAGLVDGIVDDLDAEGDRLSAREQVDADDRAQYGADLAAHERHRAIYNEQAARYNALPPSERARYQIAITTSAGTSEWLPAEEGLRRSLASLDELKADLEARDVRIAAAEEETARARLDYEAKRRDVLALLEQAYPGQSFE